MARHMHAKALLVLPLARTVLQTSVKENARSLNDPTRGSIKESHLDKELE